jgi:LysM repeat protein
MHDDFEHLIERSLDERSTDLRVGDGSIDDVLLRVDRRSNRRRATAVVGSLAVITVGLVGLSVVQGADEPAGPAAGPDTAPATSAPLGLVEGYQDAYRCTNQLDVPETDPFDPKYFASCEMVLLENGVPVEVVATSVAVQAPTTWVACQPYASIAVPVTTVPCGTLPPTVDTTIGFCEEVDGSTGVAVSLETAVATVPCTTTMPTWPVNMGEQEYTVRAGDNLAKIADRFQVSVEIVANYNEWPDGSNHLLLPGETILIPPGGAIPNG